MQNSNPLSRLLVFGLISFTLAACGGGSSTPTVPVTATIFYAHSLGFRNNTGLAFRNSTTFAWGYNGFGQLGVSPSLTRSPAPLAVPFLIGMSGVSMGSEHSVAFMNNSTVRAWGYNAFNQLGATTGALTYSLTPLKVANLTGITAVSAGGHHSLALKKDTTVWAWGLNSSGQLGDGTIISGTNLVQNNPVQVQNSLTGAGLTGIIKIAAGGSHSLALQNNGTVWAWGDNSYGQLGNLRSAIPSASQAIVVNLPAGMTAPHKIIDIAAGGSFSLALTDDGRVWAWGYNGIGQLGVDPAVIPFSETPLKITTPAGTDPVLNILKFNDFSGVRKIAAGLDHVLALRGNGGGVWGWGFGYYGQLGNASLGVTTAFSSPAKVQPGSVADVFFRNLSNNASIVAIGNHSLAFDGNKTWTWGDNGQGQLGDGTTVNRAFAAPVAGFQ